MIRGGGTLVSIAGPSDARPDNGQAIDFVVESYRAHHRRRYAIIPTGETP